MKRTVLVCSIFFAANAFAGRIAIPPGQTLHRVTVERKAQVLREARGIFNLPDGTQWVAHPAPAQREPSAIAITRFGRDGSARVFLVSDWLPKGTIPRGWCGQVYGVALLDDGRLAVSAGWMDRSRTVHNGIFVLRGRDDGGYDTDNVIEMPGVRHIVGGPSNTILAVTVDATRRDFGPQLTIVHPNGLRLAALVSQPMASVTDAMQNATRARLHRVTPNRFAFYEPVLERVLIFDLEMLQPTHAVFKPYGGDFIGDDRLLSKLRVVDIHAWPDGEFLVVRSGSLHGRSATYLNVYESGGVGPKESIVLDRPWNFMFGGDKGKLHGVVYRNGVELDTIEFAP